MCTCLLQPHIIALLRVSFTVLDLASNNPVRCFLPVLVVTGKRQKWFARLLEFHPPFAVCLQNAPTRKPDAVSASRHILQQSPGKTASTGASSKRQYRTRYPKQRDLCPNTWSWKTSLATPFYDMTRFWSYTTL